MQQHCLVLKICNNMALRWISFYFLGNLLIGQKTFLYIVAVLIVKVCIKSAYAVTDPGIVNFEQSFNYDVNIFSWLDILNKALIHFAYCPVIRNFIFAFCNIVKIACFYGAHIYKFFRNAVYQLAMQNIWMGIYSFHNTLAQCIYNICSLLFLSAANKFD